MKWDWNGRAGTLAIAVVGLLLGYLAYHFARPSPGIRPESLAGSSSGVWLAETVTTTDGDKSVAEVLGHITDELHDDYKEKRITRKTFEILSRRIDACYQTPKDFDWSQELDGLAAAYDLLATAQDDGAWEAVHNELEPAAS
ncbi:MAG: hypothetical protein KDB73_11270 [Planctomycetes bacterium]|nr:hypothetical protein [Planctomycetota bacterium]